MFLRCLRARCTKKAISKIKPMRPPTTPAIAPVLDLFEANLIEFDLLVSAGVDVTDSRLEVLVEVERNFIVGVLMLKVASGYKEDINASNSDLPSQILVMFLLFMLVEVDK